MACLMKIISFECCFEQFTVWIS